MHNKNEVDQLRKLGAEIENHRRRLDISKNLFCQKFGHLGSTKTYGRILNDTDDLDGMKIASKIEDYSAALELIQSFKEDPEESRIYGDFDYMQEAVATIMEAKQMTDNTRMVLVTAPSGGGKSTIVEYLEEYRETSAITYRIEATEAWRRNINDFLGAMILAIGIDRSESEEGEAARKSSRKTTDRGLPQGANERLVKLIRLINGRSIIIAIDEGHHIGPEGYNIIKTIINQTRAVFVLTGIPELIHRINKKSHAEAQQLFTNRMYCHVRIPPPGNADILTFLKRRGVKIASPQEAQQIAFKLSDDAPAYGLWKYVKRFSRECRKEAVKLGEKAITVKDAAAIITRVKNSIDLS